MNQAFAAKFFPVQNVIGKRIEPGATSGHGTEVREIIAIVGNARQTTLELGPEPIYYLPFKQMPWCCGSVLVRSSTPLHLESGIRTAVASLDSQLPIYEVRTLDQLLGEGVAGPRFLMLLLSGFAVIALLLTMTGLYGLVAYAVVMRTREIGLRIALGARPIQVLGLILKRAVILVLLGMAIGLAGAFAAARVIRTMLYEMSPHKPLLLGAACLFLLLTAGASAWLSARRAARIDPIQALRNL